MKEKVSPIAMMRGWDWVTLVITFPDMSYMYTAGMTSSFSVSMYWM